MDFDRYTGNNWLVIEANIVAACQKCVHYVGLHVSSEMTHERHVLPLFDTFFRILYHIYMNLLVETCRPVNKQMCEDVGKYLFIWLVIGSRTYALKLPSGHSSGHVWISPFFNRCATHPFLRVNRAFNNRFISVKMNPEKSGVSLAPLTYNYINPWYSATGNFFSSQTQTVLFYWHTLAKTLRWLISNAITLWAGVK